MASADNFMIRCKTENGSFILKDVNEESSVQELKMHLSKETGLKPEGIKILCGYPPKALADGTDSLKLKEVDINSGETIIIEKKKNAVSEPKRESPPSVSAVKGFIKQEKPYVKQEKGIVKAKGIVKQEKGFVKKEMASGPSRAVSGLSRAVPGPSRAASGPSQAVSNESAAFVDDFFSGGIMMRHVVPSNNSCLFTSVYFVMSNGDMNPKKSNELRKVIANAVAKNPFKYTDVFLGMKNKDYCAWILNTDHWGGGIELSILSEHFGIEIVAVDTINLKMHRFGENQNYSNRIFLIYDGIHYDPLVLEMGNGPMQTYFPSNDEHAMDMALEIAREAKSSRQYTDVANFTLQCSDCGEKLRGDKEARAHAISTHHVNFGEVTN